jgi:hypothetical protein
MKSTFVSTSILGMSILGMSSLVTLLMGVGSSVKAETKPSHSSAALLAQTTPIQTSSLLESETFELDTISSHIVHFDSVNLSDSVNLAEPSLAKAIALPAQDLTLAQLDLKQICSDTSNAPCQLSASSVPTLEIAATDTDKTLQSESEQSAKPIKSRSGFAVAPSISTLGAGIELTKSVVPHLNARIGANFLNVDIGRKIKDVDYTSTVNLLNVSALGDIYPWKNGGFHITAGVIYSDNTLDGIGKPQGNTFKIGNTVYQASDVGIVKLRAAYPRNFSPYIGLGWGNPVGFNKRLSVNINAGVVFTGSPQAEFTVVPNPSLPSQIQDQIRSDVQKEQNKIQDALNDFSIYPVISVSISYQF